MGGSATTNLVSEFYDPINSAFGLGPSMSYTRPNATANLLPASGQVLVAGGRGRDQRGRQLCSGHRGALDALSRTAQIRGNLSNGNPEPSPEQRNHFREGVETRRAAPHPRTTIGAR